jgi:hypothetical protein
MQDAARSQYETPTPVPSIGPPPKDPGMTRMPDTGLDIGFVAIIAILALGSGLLIRWRTR